MDKVKVLIAQSGSIEYVMRDYYERYKDDGIILIPEDEPVALTENTEIHLDPVIHKETMVSVEDLKVELPKVAQEVQKKPKSRQKRAA